MDLVLASRSRDGKGVQRPREKHSYTAHQKCEVNLGLEGEKGEPQENRHRQRRRLDHHVTLEGVPMSGG